MLTRGQPGCTAEAGVPQAASRSWVAPLPFRLGGRKEVGVPCHLLPRVSSGQGWQKGGRGETVPQESGPTELVMFSRHSGKWFFLIQLM